MTDEQFLTLDKLAARSHADGQAPVEQLRLMALYKTRLCRLSGASIPQSRILWP